MKTILEKIKEQVDIINIIGEYLDLSKKGKNYWAICPFHEDSNPSMSISYEKQMFKCFVCGIGGDVVKFVAQYEKISFQKALQKLGLKVGINVEIFDNNQPKYSKTEEILINVMNDSNEYFKYYLMTDKGAKALIYAKKRGLNNKTRELFHIGYAPKFGLKDFLLKKGHDETTIINAGLTDSLGNDFFKDRLIFAITNLHGDVIAFSGRDFYNKSKAKYINSHEFKLFSKSSTLYNIFLANALAEKEKVIYINEGFMDVIAMTKAGFNNSIAIMGTALTKNHLTFLKNKKIILMLDSDEAGLNATIKAIKLLLDNSFETKVISMNNAKDADEILSTEGIDGLKKIVENTTDALEFILELHIKRYPLTSPNNIKKFLESFAKYLINTSEITKNFYVLKLKKFMNMSKDVILKYIPIETNIKTKQQTTTLELKKTILKQRNYSYQLILSMLKNNGLIKDFNLIKNKDGIHFTEPILNTIAEYLIRVKIYNEIKKPSKEIRQKVKEIKKYNEFVNSQKEFRELISRVNKDTIKNTIETFKLKLNDTSDINEKAELITQIAKMKVGNNG